MIIIKVNNTKFVNLLAISSTISAAKTSTAENE